MSKALQKAMQMQSLVTPQSSTTNLRLLRHRHLSPCDVFINHRGIDTKRNVAGLLFELLSRQGLRPFLDNKNMKPGDKLFEKIDEAILGCKVGVAVFSRRYCDSYFCLHELALFMEAKKKVIPVFYDVKPSELVVKDDGSCSPHDLDRFNQALDKAKFTVGLSFDSSNGDWPGFLSNASEAVVKSLIEMEREENNDFKISML